MLRSVVFFDRRGKYIFIEQRAIPPPDRPPSCSCREPPLQPRERELPDSQTIAKISETEFLPSHPNAQVGDKRPCRARKAPCRSRFELLRSRGRLPPEADEPANAGKPQPAAAGIQRPPPRQTQNCDYEETMRLNNLGAEQAPGACLHRSPRGAHSTQSGSTIQPASPPARASARTPCCIAGPGKHQRFASGASAPR